MSRLIDGGALTAAYVGIGMAITIGLSFLLIIPIEPIYWALSIPAGLLIGYYAGVRSGRRRGEWARIIANAVFASLATGLTLAALLLAVKALFFFADDGYRDPGLGGRISCAGGADCVYQRYLEREGGALRDVGVTDATSFSAYYWAQQALTAELLVAAPTAFGLIGGVLYGLTRPRGTPGAVAASPAASS
ncbi:MAG TPA: hypothetical protein VEX41_04895 [Candidatus Eisenbacteria bacterium]|nr:hypothetical protein [Candidatus Eisenbacteria bacterium]